MKNYLMYFCCVLAIEATGQEKTDELKAADTTSLRLSDDIVLFPDSAATPVGGYGTFYDYVLRNIQYPKEARSAGITGKVIVEFVIEKDGSISSENIRVLKSPHASLSEEAIRLIKKSPKWMPGESKGIPVRTKKVMPISFNLGSSKSK